MQAKNIQSFPKQAKCPISFTAKYKRALATHIFMAPEHLVCPNLLPILAIMGLENPCLIPNCHNHQPLGNHKGSVHLPNNTALIAPPSRMLS